MTEKDAEMIELAAIVLLHAVHAAGFGSAGIRAALRNLPPEADVSVRTARELLEATEVWIAAATKA
jgi:hypothetical protein